MTDAGATDLVAVLLAVGVVPVVTLHDAGRAADVTRSLVDGGLPVVEITLRTAAGLEAIAAARATNPTAVVGAGTVTTASQALEAIDAGASFLVGPGLDTAVVEAARERGVTTVPGVATPTELMQAAALGIDLVKLFPAAVLGGTAMITALSAVWPEVRFLPTGGITAETAPDYLALPQVVAVGGSWMVPQAAVDAGDWHAITAAATAASSLGAAR